MWSVERVPAGSGQGSRLDRGTPSRRVRLRVRHSLRLARRVETPESRSAVLAPDTGVCGAGGREPALSPRHPRPQVSRAAAPSLRGSCLPGSWCLCLKRLCARLLSPRSLCALSPLPAVLPGPRGGLPAALWLSEGTDEWFS